MTQHNTGNSKQIVDIQEYANRYGFALALTTAEPTTLQLTKAIETIHEYGVVESHILSVL